VALNLSPIRKESWTIEGIPHPVSVQILEMDVPLHLGHQMRGGIFFNFEWEGTERHWPRRAMLVGTSYCSLFPDFPKGDSARAIAAQIPDTRYQECIQDLLSSLKGGGFDAIPASAYDGSVPLHAFFILEHREQGEGDADRLAGSSLLLALLPVPLSIDSFDMIMPLRWSGCDWDYEGMSGS